MMKRMSFSFQAGDNETLARLKKFCAEKDLHYSQVVRRAIKEFLDRETGAKLGKVPSR